MMKFESLRDGTSRIFALAFALWVAEAAAGDAPYSLPPGARITLTEATVGQRAVVEVREATDGPLRVEFVLVSPGGASRSLGAFPGSVVEGRATVQGPELTVDEEYHSLKVIVTQDGKAVGGDSRMVRGSTVECARPKCAIGEASAMRRIR